MGVETTLCDRAGCGHPDGNHFDWLRYDVAFKLACRRLLDTGRPSIHDKVAILG
jgi:hypothetical protein